LSNLWSVEPEQNQTTAVNQASVAKTYHSSSVQSAFGLTLFTTVSGRKRYDKRKLLFHTTVAETEKGVASSSRRRRCAV